MSLIEPYSITQSKSRINRVLILVCLGYLYACTPANKSPVLKKTLTVPAGWYISLNNSSVELLKAVEQKNGYSINFDKTGTDKDSDYFLKMAEGIYPDRDSILKSAIRPAKSWFFERLWWYKKYKDLQVPYALTGDSINYFINRYKTVKSAIKDDNHGPTAKGSIQKRVEFTYSAKVVDEGSTIISDIPLPKKRVVMQMKWYEYCGQPCGWGFEMQREVVFAGRYIVLRISGDGPTPIWISSRQEPYGPNQWIRF